MDTTNNNNNYNNRVNNNNNNSINNSNYNLNNNTSNQNQNQFNQLYNSNTNLQYQQPFVLDNNAQLQQQQLQQQQQYLQATLQQQQQQQQQYQQPVLQFSQPIVQQFPQPVPQQYPPSVFVLPSPTSNNIPIVNSSLQFQPPNQLIPVPIQQAPQGIQLIPQQANMYYPEPLQPMFYNTAYPLNLTGTYTNNNSYFPQQNDLINDPYQYQSSQDQFNQDQYQRQKQFSNRNGIYSSGSKYDAQPLQAPVPVPRGGNKNYNPLSQQSNESFDRNSPDSYNGDENELNNEFGLMKVYDNSKHPNSNMNEDDIKRQQVWNKLQQANKEKSAHKHKKGNSNGLPPVGSKVFNKKPPTGSQIPKPENNYLEKNIEAIKNKENLQHRYPEKKYENVHGKNLSSRAKKANE